MYDRRNWSSNTGKANSLKKRQITQMICLYGFFIAMIVSFVLVVIR
jgi:hypothetical protein